MVSSLLLLFLLAAASLTAAFTLPTTSSAIHTPPLTFTRSATSQRLSISKSKLMRPNKYVIQLKNNRNNNDNEGTDVIEDKNILAQTSWYATEVFGKVFGSANKNPSTNSNETSSSTPSIDLTKTPSSIKETLERIKIDNDRYYFLSGQVDALSYDPQCYFADPFVGFKGTDRFIDNLQNLGSFITKYDVKLLKYDVSDDELEVNTKLMVKLELNLPWKPILAWPWGVKYEIDEESFLIVSHVESWDIDALEGVKQVFRKPTLKL